MEAGTTMEIISKDDPVDIHDIFIQKFEGKRSWVYKKKQPGAYVIYIIKNANSGLSDEGFSVVNEFDVRPYPPAEWHEMFQKTYAFTSWAKLLNSSTIKILNPYITKSSRMQRGFPLGI